MVQRNEGVAFLPHMCVEQEFEQGRSGEVQGEGDESGTQDPAGVSGQTSAEPRGAGVSGDGGGGLAFLGHYRMSADYLDLSPKLVEGRASLQLLC